MEDHTKQLVQQSSDIAELKAKVSTVPAVAAIPVISAGVSTAEVAKKVAALEDRINNLDLVAVKDLKSFPGAPGGGVSDSPEADAKAKLASDQAALAELKAKQVTPQETQKADSINKRITALEDRINNLDLVAVKDLKSFPGAPGGGVSDSPEADAKAKLASDQAALAELKAKQVTPQ